MPKNDALIARLRSRRKAATRERPAGVKDGLDLLMAAMTAFTRFALFVGFLALAAYLGAAQHVVTGVNLADAFLLAALALALGFLALLIVVAGAVLVGAQMNFLVASAAAGATTAHLTRRQKLRVPAFMAAVAAYTVGMPWVYLQALSAQGWRAGGLLALNGLAAGALAWGWDHIQQLCRAPGQGAGAPRTTADRVAGGLGTAWMLWAAALMSALLVAFTNAMVVVVFGLIGSFCAAGFLVAVARGGRVTPGWARAGWMVMAAALVVSALVALFLPAFNGDTGVAKAFQMVALNVPGATIDVSAANLQRLERAAAQQGLPLQACRHADGSATLTNVRVLWHTLGNTGLVELWSEPTDPRHYSGSRRPRFQTSPYEQLFQLLGWRGVRVPLENGGLVVTTGSHLHCLELNGLHFDSNSASLGRDAAQDLAQQLAALKDSLSDNRARGGQPAETAVRMHIVGHADPRRRQNGTNEDLARERAEAVRDAVRSWLSAEAPQWSSMRLTVHSEGARAQARKCEGLGPAESEACHAFNRRVVLQMTTAPAP
ncbi:MAG: hypothetical protein QM788_10035 [Roseateles sp.]|uniref:hypothetical protein n=1 Tax=Roseateles sp. TaxID=1971397 RepID=UPI0039EC26CC